MSQKERRRLGVLEQVQAGVLTLIEASDRLGLSYRQTRRVYQRFRRDGDAGLVHRLRGRPGNRRGDPSVRQRAVALYRAQYADFGCTLAAEYLREKHDLDVHIETFRRWLIDEKLWHRRRKSPVKRRRRERRARFGELVQLDGSHHDWLEGRGDRCVLMVMTDDATGVTEAQFFEGETTVAAMTMFKQWSMRYGLPKEVYPDRHSIYRVNTAEADEVEARTGKRPLTQFGRSMQALNVKLTCAKSPQAKGRVERMNGTLQDRLVKALRVEGISDMESANRYLRETFLAKLNEQFAVAPREVDDAHLPVDEAELDGALCVRDERVVARDHCVCWEGRVLQLKPGQGMVNLAGKRVMVERSLAGDVRVVWRDVVIEHTPLPQRPQREPAKASLVERVAKLKGPKKPEANHPWKKRAITPAKPVGTGFATVSAAPRPPLRQSQPAR